MALSLNKPKLDNLASDIWKSAERLRGKFKSYEYQSVILPIIVIRRLECVLIDWREQKAAEVLARRPKRRLAGRSAQYPRPCFSATESNCSATRCRSRQHLAARCAC
jgi:type I restriction-modification system DNA methylase subunit